MIQSRVHTCYPCGLNSWPFCPPHSDTWLFLPHICLDASGVVFSLLFQYDSWPWVLGCSLTRTEKGWKAQSWRDVHEANCWLIHDHNHWNEIVSIASSVFCGRFSWLPCFWNVRVCRCLICFYFINLFIFNVISFCLIKFQPVCCHTNFLCPGPAAGWCHLNYRLNGTQWRICFPILWLFGQCKTCCD